MDNFDLKKYLSEGKLLKEDREEQYVDPFDNPDFYDGEGNMKDEYYKEEFGFSFKEKQNWEKILDQVKKQNNFDVFDAKSLRNYDKIEDEANQIYTQKYGSPFLKENKLVKEGMSLEFYDEDVALIANSGEYDAEIKDGKVSFSVVYEDEDDREGMEFDEDNWKDLLGSNHAFVEIASKIPTEVEALDDYVMITVNLEDLKGIASLAEGKLLKEEKGIDYLKDLFQIYLEGGDEFNKEVGETEIVKFENDESLIPEEEFEVALQSLPTTVKVDVYNVNFKKVGNDIIGTFKIKNA